MTETALPTSIAITRRMALRAGLGAAATAGLSGLLAACGGSSGGGSARMTKTVGPRTGKPITLLTIGLPGTLSNLYPGVEDGILNYYVAALVMEGLVYIAPSGTTKPALASGVRRPDARTYVYTLRTGAKFTDGSPLTVDDVIYSLQMASSAKVSPSIASYYSAAKSIRQTGRDEITVALSEPDEAFEWTPSAAGALYIAPKTFWQAHHSAIGTAQAGLLGTGPYMVTSFQPDSHVSLKASGTWWGGRPKVDAIHIEFIADDNARYLAQKSNTIQMSFNVPFESLSQWQSLSGARVLGVADRSWVGLVCDVKSGPTSDINVRRAIAQCIDRQAVVSDLLHGQGQVATAITPPEQFPGVFSPTQATARLAKIPQLPFSIAQAKRELAKSQSPHGFSATLTYPNTGPQLGAAALSLAQNLKQIGIHLNVQEVAISQWLSGLGPGKAPLQFMWYFNTTPDPAELPSYLLGASNLASYVNPRVQALLTEAAGELNPAQRAETIIEAQKLALADLPYLPLWWGKSLTAFSDKVGVSGLTSYTFESPWTGSLYSAG